MKPIPFHIPKVKREVFRVQQDNLRYFYDRLHLHDEIQFTLIEAGSGILMAGDYIGRFNPGDVFVIGKELPHVFRCDASYYHSAQGVEGKSVFFDESYAGNTFWENEEPYDARIWLNQSGQGYRVTGESCLRAAELIREMVLLSGLKKLVAGFELVMLLSEDAEMEALSIQEGKHFPKQILDERMDKIVGFSFREYHRPVTIEEVAALVSLTPSAFCRYFKLRTRKTYLTFINEVRISQACRLLLTTDLPINEISTRVGFNNLSHFNQYFRRSKSCTPGMYRHTGTLTVEGKA